MECCEGFQHFSPPFISPSCDASVIYVPPPAAAAAVLEALEVEPAVHFCCFVEAHLGGNFLRGK